MEKLTILNIASKAIFQEALDHMEKRILLNGERLISFRYTDDTVIVSDNLNEQSSWN